MRIPSRMLGALAALIATVSLPAQTATAQPAAFSPEQRQAIEGIVKEYLLRNPEVLQEVIGELEKRQAETQRQAQQAALASSQQELTSTTNGSVVGNPSGDITLVEFFDYNCGYCKRSLADIRALMKADPKLRVILRDFPVLGPDSIEATKVALGVKQQLSGDKLFEYHSRLLDSRGRVGGERALAVAKEMGLDMARLQKDVASKDVAATIAATANLGEKLNLSGTPAFIVGDEVISGAVGFEPLSQAIAMVRKCGKAAC